MGSSYTLYEIHDTEVCLNEMSNRLSLAIHNASKDTFLRTQYLTPAEMLKLFMEGIKCISYWMNEEEFNKIFSSLKTYPF